RGSGIASQTDVVPPLFVIWLVMSVSVAVFQYCVCFLEEPLLFSTSLVPLPAALGRFSPSLLFLRGKVRVTGAVPSGTPRGCCSSCPSFGLDLSCSLFLGRRLHSLLFSDYCLVNPFVFFFFPPKIY
ncbi:unnamed protein product, partial [Ectocarpus sp. 12 AP-2014]